MGEINGITVGAVTGPLSWGWGSFVVGIAPCFHRGWTLVGRGGGCMLVS